MKYKAIIFDFDGVILDSLKIKDSGFEKIFEAFPVGLVNEFMIYHKQNGGLSRYHKIRYFYEKLLGQSIDEKTVNEYADRFSSLMKSELTNKKYLIPDAINFIRKIHASVRLHIASGTDEKELQFLCKQLGLSEYFVSIHGSPMHKNDLVALILSQNKYEKDEVCLIGDSVNDKEAALINGIQFLGYNNEELKNDINVYVTFFSDYIGKFLV